MSKKIINVAGWQRLSRQQVYENPWICVNHDVVLTPGKTEGIYGVVLFKSHAVGVIPVDTEGNTWLVRQSRYTLGTKTWEIPSGGAALNSDLLMTARRELEEETGLVAQQWERLIDLHLSNSVTDEQATVFVARDLQPGQQRLEASEDIELQKLPLEAAITMAMQGEITDAVSVAGLLRMALATRGQQVGV